jgi:hypothetical protein
MVLTEDNRSTQTKISPDVILSAINLALRETTSNPGLP